MNYKKQEKIWYTVYNLMKKDLGISKVEKSNEADYDVKGFLFRSISLNVTVRNDGNLVIMKAEAPLNKNDDTNPDVLCNRMVKNTNIRYTAYDGKITFQLVIPVGEVSGKEAENKATSEIKQVLDILKDNTEHFECDCDVYDMDEGEDIVEVLDTAESKREQDSVFDENESIDDDELSRLLSELDEDLADDPGKGVKKNNTNPKDDKRDATEANPNLLKSKNTGHEAIKPNGKKPGAARDNGGSAPSYERAPSVTQQMQDLYSEVDKVFLEKKKNADERERVLNVYAQSLEKRERDIEELQKEKERELEGKRRKQDAELEKKEEELARRVRKQESILEQREEEIKKKMEAVNIEKQDISFQWKKLKAEQDTIESKNRDLDEKIALSEKIGKISAFSEEDIKELQEKIDKLSEYITELERQNAEIKPQVAQLEEHKRTRDAQYRKLQSTADKKDQVINAFKEKQKKWQEEKSLIVEEKEAAIGDLRRLQDTLEKTESVLHEKEEELQGIRKSELNIIPDNEQLDKLRKTISTQEDKIKSLSKQLEEYKTHEIVPTDEISENDAVMNIKEALHVIGLDVDIVAGNGDMILSGNKDNCLVCINVHAGMIYCEKPVKKSSKYIRELELWTQEDIRVSYMTLSPNKVICKCKYDDPAKSMLDILDHLGKLS